MDRSIRLPLNLIAALLVGASCLPFSAHAQEGAPRHAPDRFMIAAIDVAGVTKLSPAEIERAIYPFLGPDRGNDDVIAAQKALQDAYRAKGLEAVQVDVPVQPEATFAQGIVTIVINETPVGHVRVVGAGHHPLSGIRAQMRSLVEGQPVDFRALQRDVQQANRVADQSVEPRFLPGQVPGTLDVDLKVEDSRPIHASLELNNDNSPSTKPLRLSFGVRHSNLWDAGHTLSLTYLLSPQARRQSEVFSGSYQAPLLGTPWSILLYGYTSNSNVAALGGTNVLGDGFQIGGRANYRLPGDTFQQISFGPDFKHFNERLAVNGQHLPPAPLRYVPLTAEYTLADVDEHQSHGLTIGVTAGFRAVKKATCESLGKVNPGYAITCELPNGSLGVPVDYMRGRGINASENFVRLNLDVNYALTFPGDYVLAFHAVGQVTDSSLVTNEQFAIGGMSNVRGYLVSEAMGDEGFVSSVEARLPDLGIYTGPLLDQLRFYTFAEAGYASVRAPTLGQTATFRIGSVGGGVRYRLFNIFSGEFLIGVPIRDGPVSRTGDPRVVMSVKGNF